MVVLGVPATGVTMRLVGPTVSGGPKTAYVLIGNNNKDSHTQLREGFPLEERRLDFEPPRRFRTPVFPRGRPYFRLGKRYRGEGAAPTFSPSLGHRFQKELVLSSGPGH